MKKKKLLIILLPVLLLAGGAGAYFAGVIPGGKEEAVKKAALEKPKEKVKKYVFYELPDIVVNLSSRTRGSSSYLKIKINLELDDKKDIKRIESLLPRIIDNLQVYLRELRIEDIQGSEGLYRLREELLHRVNTAAEPARINDVLFAEMLMQ